MFLIYYLFFVFLIYKYIPILCYITRYTISRIFTYTSIARKMTRLTCFSISFIIITIQTITSICIHIKFSEFFNVAFRAITCCSACLAFICTLSTHSSHIINMIITFNTNTSRCSNTRRGFYTEII